MPEQEKSPLAVAMESTNKLDVDTDGDGLKDWEELLWKTDSNKIDTDGDGTNDNEEISLNKKSVESKVGRQNFGQRRPCRPRKSRL